MDVLPALVHQLLVAHLAKVATTSTIISAQNHAQMLLIKILLKRNALLVLKAAHNAT